MPYQKDKVSDVISVLAVMKEEFTRAPGYCSITELRKNAVREIAERELQARRYKNQDSASKTIHDACARRLGPDVTNIRTFDELANQWLRKKSVELKNILLKHSESRPQRAIVLVFFAKMI